MYKIQARKVRWLRVCDVTNTKPALHAHPRLSKKPPMSQPCQAVLWTEEETYSFETANENIHGTALFISMKQNIIYMPVRALANHWMLGTLLITSPSVSMTSVSLCLQFWVDIKIKIIICNSQKTINVFRSPTTTDYKQPVF